VKVDLPASTFPPVAILRDILQYKLDREIKNT
jgi:hypothetical protein